MSPQVRFDLVTTLVCLVALASFAQQQTADSQPRWRSHVLWSVQSPSFDSYEAECADVGDVDGDRVPDVAITNGGYFVDELGQPGDASVLVRSGVDGRVVHTLLPTLGGQRQDLCASIASVGDVNGDGVGDFGFGCRDASLFLQGCVLTDGRSGAMTRVETDRRTSATFAALGDIDGDGCGDWSLSGDQLVARSGADGSVFWSVELERAKSSWAGPRALGDLDLDGTPDFADVYDDGSGAWSIRRWSGRNGTEFPRLRTQLRVTDFDWLRVELFDDTNGDGQGELLLIADARQTNDIAVRVLELDGSEERDLSNRPEFAGRRTFASLLVIEDLDCDGVRDFLLISPPWTDGAQLHLASGRTGDLIAADIGPRDSDGQRLPLTDLISRVGDLDGDTRADFAAVCVTTDSRGNLGTPSLIAFRIERVW